MLGRGSRSASLLPLTPDVRLTPGSQHKPPVHSNRSFHQLRLCSVGGALDSASSPSVWIADRCRIGSPRKTLARPRLLSYLSTAFYHTGPVVPLWTTKPSAKSSSRGQRCQQDRKTTARPRGLVVRPHSRHGSSGRAPSPQGLLATFLDGNYLRARALSRPVGTARRAGRRALPVRGLLAA